LLSTGRARRLTPPAPREAARADADARPDPEGRPAGSRWNSWLLTASPRKPLVGSFANAVPWVLLGLGLLVALVATAIVLALLRRRDYALTLVDQRTTDLKRSLGQLEDAQGRPVLPERLAAIGQVAAAVGHELRNPLGVLTNSLYLIRVTTPNADQPPTSRHLDPFTQANGQSGRETGLGLGLYIVRGLVEAMDGSIEAHSRVGQGSEFVVRLQRATS
jgi:signal transduction histidine kinase